MTQAALKTYWHLARTRRKPSRYEIGSSGLLYYPDKSFAVRTPVTQWYERYQGGSAIPPQRYVSFRDPRATTYQSYVELKHERQLILAHAHEHLDTQERRTQLPHTWIDELECVLPVLRFPYQGMHMVAAYCGQMAPQSKLVIAFALQAADELGRIEQFAIRMSELRKIRPTFGELSRQTWEESDEWQPLRALMERLLVTYDFGEAWVACNLVTKPVLDRLFLDQLSNRASENQDLLTAQVLDCLMLDSSWQQLWTRGLVELAIDGDESSRSTITEWVSRWWSELRRALPPLLQLWRVPEEEKQRLMQVITAERKHCWHSLALEVTT